MDKVSLGQITCVVSERAFALHSNLFVSAEALDTSPIVGEASGIPQSGFPLFARGSPY